MNKKFGWKQIIIISIVIILILLIFIDTNRLSVKDYEDKITLKITAYMPISVSIFDCEDPYSIERYENREWVYVNIFKRCGKGCWTFIDEYNEEECNGSECMCDCCFHDEILWPHTFEISWSRKEFIDDEIVSSKPGRYRINYYKISKEFTIE